MAAQAANLRELRVRLRRSLSLSRVSGLFCIKALSSTSII